MIKVKILISQDIDSNISEITNHVTEWEEISKENLQFLLENKWNIEQALRADHVLSYADNLVIVRYDEYVSAKNISTIIEKLINDTKEKQKIAKEKQAKKEVNDKEKRELAKRNKELKKLEELKQKYDQAKE